MAMRTAICIICICVILCNNKLFFQIFGLNIQIYPGML